MAVHEGKVPSESIIDGDKAAKLEELAQSVKIWIQGHVAGW